jgi:hypothetical protein
VWGALSAPRRTLAVEEASIPLAGASQAQVKIEHGAGTLNLTGGAPADCLLAGRFGGGLDQRCAQTGDALDVKLRPAAQAWFSGPWNWNAALDWDMQLNSAVPLRLKVEAGASRTDLDLTDLQVMELKLSTGASDTRVRLPAQGRLRADFSLGAASLKLTVPEGVAARIRASTGAASLSVDTSRFPRMGDGYQSPDFETAPNAIDIKIEAGAADIKVS